METYVGTYQKIYTYNSHIWKIQSTQILYFISNMRKCTLIKIIEAGLCEL